MAGWRRGGEDISYTRSKLNRMCSTLKKPFYQLSFTYNFDLMENDETYFAYSFPYTFSRLYRLIKELKDDK